MPINFGSAADQTDDELLEGIKFWEARARTFASKRERTAAAEARERTEQLQAEAKARGLL
ncbi:hypothetical protein AB0H49_33815 [Nocardia sp. NPDC050713]|uniref:hypothetical protein n=1 Tax=Nocardia sp. NPDC050713 TaxID=3154511 RepID=UPI00340B38F4